MIWLGILALTYWALGLVFAGYVMGTMTIEERNRAEMRDVVLAVFTWPAFIIAPIFAKKHNETHP